MTWQAQASTVTRSGRHEVLFADLALILKDLGISRPRVLSFGCSTGFEPLDLKRQIPGAKVYGCDINDKALAEAKNRCAAENITIIKSEPGALAKLGTFDVITVMSVLTSYPAIQDRPDISKIYPFKLFDSLLSSITSMIAPGGFLVLYNSCYLFEQSTSAPNFVAQPSVKNRMNGWSDKYDKSGKRLTDVFGTHQGRSYPASEWRKLLANDPNRVKDLEADLMDYEFRTVPGAGVQPNTYTVFWRRKSSWSQRQLRKLGSILGTQ